MNYFVYQISPLGWGLGCGRRRAKVKRHRQSLIRKKEFQIKDNTIIVFFFGRIATVSAFFVNFNLIQIDDNKLVDMQKRILNEILIYIL